MSITSCDIQLAGGRSGSWSGDQDGASHKYTRTYVVMCSADTDDENEIVAHLGTLGVSLGATFPGDAESVCKSIDPQHVTGGGTGGHKWTVAVKYEPQSRQDEKNNDGSGNQTTDVEQWLEIEAGGYAETVAVYKAIFRAGIDQFQDGDVIVPQNAAGQPFDPPLEKEIIIRTLRVTRWRGAWDGQQAQALVNCVNNAQVVYNLETYSDVWAQYQARVRSVSGSYQLKNGGMWWKRTTEIHIHPDSWRAEIPNIGTVARAHAGDADGGGGTISMTSIPVGVPPVRKIMDVKGRAVQRPVLLGSDGKPLAEGEANTWVIYSLYPEIDFALPIAQEYI